MYEIAIALQQGAVIFHLVDSPEDTFRPDRKHHHLGILLGAPHNAYDFSILIKDRRTAIAGIGGNGDLVGEGISLKPVLALT